MTFEELAKNPFLWHYWNWVTAIRLKKWEWCAFYRPVAHWAKPFDPLYAWNGDIDPRYSRKWTNSLHWKWELFNTIVVYVITYRYLRFKIRN